MQYAYFCFFVTTLHLTSWRGDGLQNFRLTHVNYKPTHWQPMKECFPEFCTDKASKQQGLVISCQIWEARSGAVACVWHIYCSYPSNCREKNVGKLLHKCFRKEQRFLMLSQNHREGKSFPLLPAPFFYCSLSMLKRNRETCHAKCALLTPRRVRQLKRPCLEHMLIGDYWRPCSPSFPLCHSKTKSCLRTRRFCAGQDSSCMAVYI